MSGYEFALFYVGWMIAGGSPGPATLSIAGTSMENGRKAGLIFALGILAGSACLGLAAASGMSAVMQANAWVFEVLRYLGAAYLLFLAIKALRSAVKPNFSDAHQKPRRLGRAHIFTRAAHSPDQSQSNSDLGFNLRDYSAIGTPRPEIYSCCLARYLRAPSSSSLGYALLFFQCPHCHGIQTHAPWI